MARTGIAGSESDFGDRQRTLPQQAIGMSQPQAVIVVEESGTAMLSEQSVEVPRRDACSTGDGIARQRDFERRSIFSSTASRTGWWTEKRSASEALCGPSPASTWVCRNQSDTRRAKSVPMRSAIKACMRSSGATPPPQVTRVAVDNETRVLGPKRGKDSVERRRMLPMEREAASVQQTRFGEHIRAAGNAAEPHALPRQSTQGLMHRGPAPVGGGAARADEHRCEIIAARR